MASVGLPLTRISASPRKELSPAPRRGFFMRVLRAVQPMMRLGVGVVGLLSSGRDRHALQHETQLAPPVARGFCLGPCGNQASAAPLSRRACRPTSAESPATSLMDVAGWQAHPSRRMPSC